MGLAIQFNSENLESIKSSVLFIISDDLEFFKSFKIPLVSLIIFLFNSSESIPIEAISSYELDLVFFNRIIALEAFNVDITYNNIS